MRWQNLLLNRVPRSPEGEGASGGAGDAPPSGDTPPAKLEGGDAPAPKDSLLMDEGDGDSGEADPKEPAKEPAKAEDLFQDVKDLKLPEDFEFDSEEQAKGFSDLATELGLSKEGAQKLLDYGTGQVKAAIEAAVKASTQESLEHFATLQGQWKDEIVKHAELGNGKDGFKPEVKAAVSKAITQFALDGKVAETKAAFNMTGAGNNPLLAGLFFNMAKQLTEGSSIKGSPAGQSGQRPSIADAIYPHLAAEAAKGS